MASESCPAFFNLTILDVRSWLPTTVQSSNKLSKANLAHTVAFLEPNRAIKQDRCDNCLAEVSFNVSWSIRLPCYSDNYLQWIMFSLSSVNNVACIAVAELSFKQ